ncbi:hypothetical protein D3C72_1948760 [compost metagenome]
MCSVSALRSAWACTRTSDRLVSPWPAGGGRRTRMVEPSITPTRPVPARRRPSASFTVSVPATAGADRPATKVGWTISSMRVWRAKSLSACAKGWAAMLSPTAPCAVGAAWA